jgi:hypothetical protein
MTPRWFRPGRIARRAVRRAVRRNTRRYFRRRTRRLLIGGAILLALRGTHRAVKLQQRDVHRLEDHYGRPVEELSEDEVDQGMQRLGIREMDMDEQDRAKVYQADKDDDDFDTDTMNYCMYCGAVLKQNTNYCPSCGAKL